MQRVIWRVSSDTCQRALAPPGWPGILFPHSSPLSDTNETTLVANRQKDKTPIAAWEQRGWCHPGELPLAIVLIITLKKINKIDNLNIHLGFRFWKQQMNQQLTSLSFQKQKTN